MVLTVLLGVNMPQNLNLKSMKQELECLGFTMTHQRYKVMFGFTCNRRQVGRFNFARIRLQKQGKQ
jgi:hypothetical protein